MIYRLTELASEDFRSVVRHSAELYGAVQAGRYGALLRHAITTIANTPDRPNSRDRGDLGHGVRSFPAAVVADRLGAVRHVVFYRIANDGVTEILRILHDSMDPARHFEPPTR